MGKETSGHICLCVNMTYIGGIKHKYVTRNTIVSQIYGGEEACARVSLAYMVLSPVSRKSVASMVKRQ